MAHQHIENIELLTFSECYDQIERQRLERQMRYVLVNSPFYQEKYRSAGLNLEDTLNINNLTKLPFTEKNEILYE